MNLDIDHVIVFFSLKYGVLYRLGLDGFWRVSDDPL